MLNSVAGIFLALAILMFVLAALEVPGKNWIAWGLLFWSLSEAVGRYPTFAR